MVKLSGFILLTTLFFMFCDDNEDRAQFHWDGTINGIDTTWTIGCTGDCSACSAHPKGSATPFYWLDKNSYPDVFNKCSSFPGPPIIVDTNKKTVVPTGKLSFKVSSAMVYGYDSHNGVVTPDTVNYLSIAVNCSTSFLVNIPSGSSNAYNSIIAVLPSSAINKISFDKTTNRDTVNLVQGDNDIKIYSIGSASNGTTFELYIYGVADSKSPDCLAGDCYGAEDRLKVVIYQEKVYTNYQLYLVNNPVFNPDSNAWKNGFNKIVKQAVIRMGAPNKVQSSDLSWDKNNNGIFDDFFSYDSVPIGKIEFIDLLKSVNEFDTGCYVDKKPTTIVLKGPIRMHWMLTEDIAAGSHTIQLNSVETIPIGSNIMIGPWLGLGGTQYESVFVLGKDSILKIISICQDSGHSDLGLKYDHKMYETFWEDKTHLGVTVGSCSCTRDTASYYVHAHEFLHQNIVGGLFHVADTDNVMYQFNNNKKGSYLRYRNIKLQNSNSTESQWNKLKH